MRLTFSDLLANSQDAVGKDTSTASATFFKRRINARHEQVLGKLPSHFSEIERTFSTVAEQQYYHIPPNYKSVKSLMITIGSVDYPLETEFSYSNWRKVNSVLFQAGAIPSRYFSRQRDFGIWPIPQDAYTGTIVYNIRAGGMTKTDYTTGTVTVTENSQTVEGSGTTFTGGNAAIDMWFSLADSNGESKGSWYRISSVTDATNLTLESFFEESTASGESYIIGESPELPEDLHDLLFQGAVADYYASFRQDLAKAQSWNNMFWTGDWSNSSRVKVEGGLLNAILRYQDRDDSQLVKRVHTSNPRSAHVFGVTLSDS